MESTSLISRTAAFTGPAAYLKEAPDAAKEFFKQKTLEQRAIRLEKNNGKKIKVSEISRLKVDYA